VITLSVNESKSDASPKGVEQRVVDLNKGLAQYGGGFAIPPDSGMKTALARFTSLLFESLTEPTIYISEWSIWPSSENPDLFDSYRQAKGEVRSLEETPVHRFSSASENAFVGILCFVLYFLWDAQVFDLEGKCLVTISHDEWISIRTNDPKIRQQCDQAVKEGLLKRLSN